MSTQVLYIAHLLCVLVFFEAILVISKQTLFSLDCPAATGNSYSIKYALKISQPGDIFIKTSKTVLHSLIDSKENTNA